jgi:hypothetical protein
MNDDQEDLSSFRDGHWRVQPPWVKAVVIWIAVPAWLLFMATVLMGNIGGTVQMIAFGVFGAVALLTLAFVFRAYWRLDL